MKKLISIVLCIAVIFGVSVQGYVAAEPEIIATVSNQNSDEITACGNLPFWSGASSR